MSDLDIRVDIAPDAEPDGDPNDWLWRDVSGYRRQSGDVEMEYGRSDEASDVEPGSATATFDLRDGLLSPRNPTSELYGRIGPNTPIRYRLRIAEDTFDGRTVASGWGTASDGHTWAATSLHSVSSGSGKIALSVVNTAVESRLTDAAALDTDITYSVSLSAVTTGGPWLSGLIVRRVDASNQYRVNTELKPAGVVTIKLVRVDDGAITDIIEDVATAATYSAGTKVWTRVQSDGGVLRAKVWSGVLADEPDVWNIWSTLVRIEAGGIGMYHWRYVGNTNVGTLTASVDDFMVDALLWAGNVPEWPPRWDKSGQDSTISLTAAGPFRRIDQGEESIRSPLARQLLRYGPAGYWRLEDGSEATTAASDVAGGVPAYVSGVTFGDEDCPGGAASAMKLGGTGTYNFRGQITGNTTGNFAAMFFVKFPTLPASTDLIEWRTRGTVRRWVIRATSTGWQLKVYDAVGDLLYDGGTVIYVDAPSQWTAVQLEVVQDGANIDWALIWNRVGSETFWAVTDTFAGTSVRLTDVLIPSTVGTVDALLSHIWAGTEALPFVAASFLAVASGYAGELASDRIDRLCDEEGVLVTIAPGDSEPLGRQRPGKFLELLREASKADVGVLYERLGSTAFLPRSRRINGDVRMVLDWAAGDLAEAPLPTDDDQRLRNRWRVSRTGGSEATAENAASIAKHGLTSDAAELNIQTDARLPRFAEWFTHLTTQDALRWPSIEIDLIANPALIPQFLTCRIGSRIQVINPKAQIPGITIDLIIEGVKQTIGRNRWDVTLACSPALPWQVGVYDDTTKRYDSRGTTLNASYDDSDTTMVITFPVLGDAWSTVSEPYDWDVAGERITVTSMGAVTGTFGAYTQSATVTRSVNGVVKPQDAQTPVHIHPAQAARYAP
jgi:hypothetical protein